MRAFALLGAGLLTFSSLAQAETLPVGGVYAAGNDQAASIQSIAVENFGGTDGPTLSLRIEDLLRGVSIRGRQWFAVMPASGGAEADSILRGSASADVSHLDIKLMRSRCQKRDEDKKCIEYKDVEVDCKRRTVRLPYSVRLVRWRGELVYSNDGAPEQQLDYCPRDDDNVKTVESTVTELIQGIASSTRYALAPYESRSNPRVMESRKGLKGDANKAFKAAVTLTKTDTNAACASWEEWGLSMPGNLSITFNRGLCAEMRNELDIAGEHYLAALQISAKDGYSSDGLRRVDLRQRAEQQIAAHWAE